MDRLFWSIDLDFWARTKDPFPIEVFDRFLHLNIPIYIVKSHESMLDCMSGQERIDFDVLINSDHHSDIAEVHGEFPRLNEGTWINRVPGRRNRTYIWHYPLKSCLTHNYPGGYCHANNKYNPFFCKYACQWGTIFKRQTFLPQDGDGQLVSVGISVSPDWVSDKTLKAFEPWYWKAIRKPLVNAEEDLSECFKKVYAENLR